MRDGVDIIPTITVVRAAGSRPRRVADTERGRGDPRRDRAAGAAGRRLPDQCPARGRPASGVPLDKARRAAYNSRTSMISITQARPADRRTVRVLVPAGPGSGPDYPARGIWDLDSGKSRSTETPEGTSGVLFFGGGCEPYRRADSVGIPGARGRRHRLRYPGGAILPAYDALLQYPIRHVLVRHEQGAAHMADGYARATGKVGVAMATSGPGATNLITGIATAMMDSVPIVVITGPGARQGPGHRRLPGDRRHRHHAAHHQAQLPGDGVRGPGGTCARPSTSRATAAPVRFWSTSARTPAGHDRVRVAGDGRPARRQVPAARCAGRTWPTPPSSCAGGRPLILAGHGVMRSGASADLREFAEKTHIPVALTLLGLGGFRAPSAVPRHDGDARRGLRQHRHPGGRPPARLRHALRRPRDRQPRDLRPEVEEDPRRHRPLRDRQERARRRRDRRRPARGAGALLPHVGQRTTAWLDGIEGGEGHARRATSSASPTTASSRRARDPRLWTPPMATP